MACVEISTFDSPEDMPEHYGYYDNPEDAKEAIDEIFEKKEE